MSLETEFIPYEQALALRELGFDEPCFGFYIGDIIRLCSFTNYPFKNSIVPYDTQEYTVTAILYQQAFRWFREKYSHYAFLQPTSDLISENYCFKILDQYSGKFYSKSYEKYEEAELECLKKLIEIVKSK